MNHFALVFQWQPHHLTQVTHTGMNREEVKGPHALEEIYSHILLGHMGLTGINFAHLLEE